VAMAVGEPRMSDAGELQTLYEAKARAELGDADAIAGARPGAWTGEVMAAVALVVGEPGDPTGTPLRGVASEAVAKALTALGFLEGSAFVISSRPRDEAGDEALVGRLRLALEAVDPTLVMALDAQGARDLSAAYDLPELSAGRPVGSLGRTFGYAGEFVASLGDDSAKAPVWGAMKAIARADAAKTSARRQSAPREKSGMRKDGPRA